MEKALIIKGPCRDLEDVLNIARANGRAILGEKFINVKPIVSPYGSNDYIVVVEAVGWSKDSGVGTGKT